MQCNRVVRFEIDGFEVEVDFPSTSQEIQDELAKLRMALTQVESEQKIVRSYIAVKGERFVEERLFDLGRQHQEIALQIGLLMNFRKNFRAHLEREIENANFSSDVALLSDTEAVLQKLYQSMSKFIRSNSPNFCPELKKAMSPEDWAVLDAAQFHLVELRKISISPKEMLSESFRSAIVESPLESKKSSWLDSKPTRRSLFESRQRDSQERSAS